MAPFVILGGGPCGLAAAWHLSELGHQPVVLEREALVGGLCATHRREGWRFDLGGHRIVSSDDDLTVKLKRLLDPDLLIQERRSIVLHEGRRFRYPLEARDLVLNLGVVENVRALAGYARERALQYSGPRKERTFEEWVTARFGRPLYDAFFGPYTQKLWGIPPDQISADWAAERISLLHLGDALLRLSGVPRPEVRTYARRYLYPRYGMGQLCEAIGAEVERAGGEVRTRARVVGLETRGNRVIAVRVESPTGAELIPVREILSTVPLPELVRFLGPRSADIGRRAGTLRFRALVFLNLLLRRQDFSENTWMYVASGTLRISRIQEPKRRSPWMAPPGRTSLLLEIPCSVGDATWEASATELLPLMLDELRTLGFVVDDVIDAFVVRVEEGYPIYHLGYDEDRRAMLAEVSRFENLRTAGRQGLFRYVFLDAAMQMGIRAARQMAEGVRDPDALDAIGRSRSVVEARALTA